MAYRAPELYDIHPGSKLDEKVDIWVGITIFLFFFSRLVMTFSFVPMIESRLSAIRYCVWTESF